MTESDEQLPPHHAWCLGCGDENPASIGVRMRIDGERVRAEVTFDRRQEGAPGYVHGGAIATVMDDTFGTLLIVQQAPAVTAQLEVSFTHPAFIGSTYQVEAWCEQVDGRKLYFRGTLTAADGTCVAAAHALFVRVDVQHFLKGSDASTMPW